MPSALLAAASLTLFASNVASHASGIPMIAACGHVATSQTVERRLVVLSPPDCADIRAARRLGPRLPDERYLLGPWNLLHEAGHVQIEELGLNLSIGAEEHQAECRALRMLPKALPAFRIYRGSSKFRRLLRLGRDAVLHEAAPYGGACYY